MAGKSRVENEAFIIHKMYFSTSFFFIVFCIMKEVLLSFIFAKLELALKEADLALSNFYRKD